MNSELKTLLDLYNEFPFKKHPLWRSVLAGELTKDEIISAEEQHAIRSFHGRDLRKKSLENTGINSPEIWQATLSTYIEECTDRDGTPPHLDLAMRLTRFSNPAEIAAAAQTPGNIAAIAIYRAIGERGIGHHLIGAGIVEHFYSELCGDIFKAYVTKYGFSEHEAETYQIHSSMDKTHAERSFSVFEDVRKHYDFNGLKQTVFDAIVATSLHYDGMLQAAKKHTKYWDGKS